MNRSLLCLAATALLGFAAPARAGLTFDFINGPSGALPDNPHVFSAEQDASKKITAFGGNSSLNLVGLFVKKDGGDENGLGLVNDPSGDHEITPNSGILLDFSALKAQIAIKSIDFLIGSAQKGEGFQLLGFDGSNLKPIYSAIDTIGTHPATLAYTVGASDVAKYNGFVVTAIGGCSANILLDSVTVNAAVPEPASMAMTALGVVATLAGYRLKRCGAKSA